MHLSLALHVIAWQKAGGPRGMHDSWSIATKADLSGSMRVSAIADGKQQHCLDKKALN